MKAWKWQVIKGRHKGWVAFRHGDYFDTHRWFGTWAEAMAYVMSAET